MKRLLLLFFFWRVSEQTTEHSPRGPWQLAFRAVHNKKSGSHADFYNLFISSDTLNENVPSIIRDFTRSGQPYKSKILEDWQNKIINVQTLKLSFYKNGEEKQYIVFNGVGQDKSSWMDCKNILYSSYTDIVGSNPALCGMGPSTPNQRFAIMKTSVLTAPCPDQKGWIYNSDRSATFYPCSGSWPDSVAEKPFFLYASGNNSTTFTSGIEKADSMAIFLQVWDLVFKGVSGTDGSLYHIWSSTSISRNSNSSAAKSLSTSDLQTYKSTIVNRWTSLNVDRVKYAMFDSASVETSYVVFSGRNSNLTDWFSHDRILYSNYEDINETKSVCSIEGDGIRTWQIHKTSSNTCTDNEAWMQILDETNGTQPCAWDSVAQRPYFLYSSLSTAAKLQTGSSFNAADVKEAKRMGIFVHGWHSVFKISAGESATPSASVYDLWMDNVTLNTESDAANSTLPGSPNYKSDIVNTWDSHIIRAVKLGFYSGGEEKASIVFDATIANETNWFDCRGILYTTFHGLVDSSPSVCSVTGEGMNGRRFMLADNTDSCNTYSGWFVVLDQYSSKVCPWESSSSSNLTRILYSANNDKDLFTNFVEADAMVVFLDMNECLSNPCKNGGRCEETAGTHLCHCDGNYYGSECVDRDGNWSDWTEWVTCSVTCGGGVSNRSRECNNPVPEGSGSCPGEGFQNKSCNIHKCPIDGSWSNWTEWTNCTAECNGGLRNRSRQCNNPAPQYGGANCSGNATEEQVCNAQPCPIDGGWSNWTSWSECTKTCNGGTQIRTKSCTNPPPQHGGQNCTGISEESRECNNMTCPPVDGNWGAWSNWSVCSASCEGGNHTRTRECNDPMPEFGGQNCTGNWSDIGVCNEQNCPIDGGWGNWSEYSNCTNLKHKVCGDGENVRSRTCSNPAPQYGGQYCSGNATDSLPCHLNCSLICPDLWQTHCVLPQSSCSRPCPTLYVIGFLSLLFVICRLN